MHHFRFGVSIPSESYSNFQKSKPSKFRKELATSLWTEKELKERAFRTNITKKDTIPFTPKKKKVFRGKNVKKIKFFSINIYKFDNF